MLKSEWFVQCIDNGLLNITHKLMFLKKKQLSSENIIIISKKIWCSKYLADTIKNLTLGLYFWFFLKLLWKTLKTVPFHSTYASSVSVIYVENFFSAERIDSQLTFIGHSVPLDRWNSVVFQVFLPTPVRFRGDIQNVYFFQFHAMISACNWSFVFMAFSIAFNWC